MKILVVGSEGNIGKPLVRHLKALGHQVMECDIQPGWRPDYYVADINHPIDLLPAFDWSPEVVFILSAMVSRVTCEQASSLAVATNMAGINNVLQLCLRAKARTIFFSTSEVYGPECDPMDESLSNPRPNNRYGLTKLLGEQLVEYEVRTNALQAVTLRPFMMYDENEDFGAHRSAMIRFAENLATGREIEVHRGSERGWLHVTDAVRAIEAAMAVSEYSVINIGHPEFVPIETLAEMIREELGARSDLIKILDLPARMTLVKRPRLQRQEQILGVRPAVNLAAGVKLVCNRVRDRIARGEISAEGVSTSR